MAKSTTNKPQTRKPSRVVEKGKMFVTATFNNTLVTITDTSGNVAAWGSTGKAGFSGSKKSTPYAATVTIEEVVNQAKTFGLRGVEVYIKGPGPGRDAALRVLRSSGLKIDLIADVTPIPHNGTRPRKKKHNR
ncbi:30S ribosomal protein S11 [Pseudomonadota bacterium]